MAPSQAETDFRRLLGKCEIMVSDAHKNGGNIEWRVEKYLDALQARLQDIGRQSKKPDDDILREYKRKVDFLQGIVKAENMPTTESKVRACQQLIPVSTNLVNDSTKDGEKLGTHLSKDVHIQSKGRYHKEMRKELLGYEDSSNDLRQRRGKSSFDDETKENVDDILKYHHDAQEKIADEMIKMAQSMKHTSLIANNIIKKDEKTLQKSTKLVDTNFQKLKKESDRLEEMNKRGCSWWLWIMLTIVCVVFFLMILFIKFFPVRNK
ncbi:vesicle transport protein USE1-like isoform X2 [Rhopilema esculentum]|uniref:vesicle transport protein USE1-like isoform X2 n=1 Tax=Rhopilema esculentum TaxID=499914 RepID=UPI0031DA3474